MSQMMSNEQELPEEQYEKVLKYMEATSQEDYGKAVGILKAHDFNLENSINTRFAMNQPVDSNPNPNRQMDWGNNIENQRQNRQENSQQEVRKYIQYLRQKNNKSIFVGIYGFSKSIFCGIFVGLFELLLPEFIKRRIIRSTFYNRYTDQMNVKLVDKSLANLLKNNYRARKPIIFFVGNQQRRDQCFIQLMSNMRVGYKIKESFIVSGTSYTKNNLTRQQIQKFAPLKESQIPNPPSILILRQTVRQQPQIIHRFTGEQQITKIKVQTLNLVLRAFQYQHRKDRNTLIKYRNHVRRQYYGERPGFFEEQDDQDQQYGLLDSHHIINSSLSNNNTEATMNSSNVIDKARTKSQVIQQQNQKYKLLQQQIKQRESVQIQEKKKIEELQQERKMRKISIPDQPLQGDNIYRVNFRCPDGSMLTRNFIGDQKIDLLYQWVQTNPQIQFEDNNKRTFQLLYSFPPAPLCKRKQQLIKDAFESDQQKLMIRQL